jgi:hypothetical protein
MNRYVAVVLVACCVAAVVLTAVDAQDPQARSDRVVPKAWQHLALEHAGVGVIADPQLAGKIDQLGNEGWELVSVGNVQVDGTTIKTVFYFKRPR